MGYKLNGGFLSVIDLSRDIYFLEDVQSSVNYLGDLSSFYGKTIGITGATGLIGRNLVYTFHYMNLIRKANIKVVLFVRNEKKALSLFRGFSNNIEIIHCDLSEKIQYKKKIDYIIHTAADTRSIDMVEHPLEVIESIYNVTKNVLDLCVSTNVQRFIYLSSMEVYGNTSKNDGLISESFLGRININSIRSCYPEAKRLSEILVRAYSNKFKFKSIILRPTQTFGAGVSLDDKRVFAQFAVEALKSKKIILNTEGKTIRSYLYLSDLTDAILQVIQFSADKMTTVFNVSNENATLSIYDMAKTIASMVEGCEININNSQHGNYGYAPTLQMKLSSKKLRSHTGWKPNVDFMTMVSRLIASLKFQLKGD